MFAATIELESKSVQLDATLKKLGRTLVAYSGGVDSAYLAWAAHQVLGDKMLAIIADSPSLARTQLSDAVAFANEQGIPLEVVATSELERPEYVRNDSQRCFFCKDELFTLMENCGRLAASKPSRMASTWTTKAISVPARRLRPITTWLRRCSMPDSPKTISALWRVRPGCESGTSPLPPAFPPALNTAARLHAKLLPS